MTRVHRLQHVERLAAAYLADDHAVGQQRVDPHEGLVEQVAHQDLSARQHDHRAQQRHQRDGLVAQSNSFRERLPRPPTQHSLADEKNNRGKKYEQRHQDGVPEKGRTVGEVEMQK